MDSNFRLKGVAFHDSLWVPQSPAHFVPGEGYEKLIGT